MSMIPKGKPANDSLADALQYIGVDAMDSWGKRTVAVKADLADFLTKVDEDFYLVSVPSQNIKQIGNMKGSLEHFQKYVMQYGMDAVTVAKLDKETAKVLYGKK